MVRETHYCDRCGNEMTFTVYRGLTVYAKRRYLLKFYGNWTTVFPDHVHFDLCKMCSENFVAWLNGKIIDSAVDKHDNN